MKKKKKRIGGLRCSLSITPWQQEEGPAITMKQIQATEFESNGRWDRTN